MSGIGKVLDDWTIVKFLRLNSLNMAYKLHLSVDPS